MKNSISYLFCLIIIGCTVPESDKLPFGEGSRYPHLAKIDSGGLLVSWLEPIDSTTFGLFWSAFDKGEWSEPGLIYSSKDASTSLNAKDLAFNPLSLLKNVLGD